PGRHGTTLLRVRAGNGWRHVETTGVNLLHDPDVRGILYITRDVEERVRERAELAHALAGQLLVADLGLLALTSSDVDALLTTALRQVGELLHAPSMSLVEQLPDGRLRFRRTLALGTGSRGSCDALAVELRGPGGRLGELTAEGRDRPYAAGDEDVLRGVANVLAGALLRAERERQAVTHALHDALTGLATRRLLLERLERAIARPGSRCAVLLVDLDRFKAVNDSFGHAAGDEVLRTLGPRLAACVRPTDTVGRYGGDEFVILCEEPADEQSVARLAERVRRACAEPFQLSNGETILLSGSIGVAWSSGAADDAQELLHAADQAMYRSKRAH
ncbi:MAG: GGDEF domain-containing protein, partial [Mycobacteriales bacterium]